MSFCNLALLFNKFAIAYVRVIGFHQCSIFIFEVCKAIESEDILTDFSDVETLQNCLGFILCDISAITGSY